MEGRYKVRVEGGVRSFIGKRVMKVFCEGWGGREEKFLRSI